MASVATLDDPTAGAFRWTLPNDAAVLSELRSRLRRYLAPPAVPAAVAADVVLSLHEAAKNALRASGRRPVEVVVWTEGDYVRAWVRDHGTLPFRADGSPGRPSVWQTHGRGLFLMQTLMDSVQIDSSDGVTVFMSKRRSPRL